MFSNLVTVFYNRYATILENRFRLQEVFTAEPEFVNFLESVAGLLNVYKFGLCVYFNNVYSIRHLLCKHGFGIGRGCGADNYKHGVIREDCT